MKATQTLHERRQSLRLDNITRAMLDGGTIRRYFDAYAVTGLTSNPSIFGKAGMHTFGASAPLKQLLGKFGFTPDQVARVARDGVAAARQ